MTTLRIALANVPFPASSENSIEMAVGATRLAGEKGVDVICFPECFVPGYRGLGTQVAPPDPMFLERAWSLVAAAAREARTMVVLGTERVLPQGLVPSVLVIDAEGRRVGFQDKVQLDPSEEGPYAPGSSRRLFRCGEALFGVVICHEGWRYPETVRWAAMNGAQIVFHPHFHRAETPSAVFSSFADPANTFHEKAILCRAAENTCWFASVNCASPDSETTSAIARPDGTLLAVQPRGEAGLLVADLDLKMATGLLAKRYRPIVSDVVPL